MLHEISYFHTQLPVSRVAACHKQRINSAGPRNLTLYNFFSYMMCSTGEAFALRWCGTRLRAPLRCLDNREMNHVWSVTHIEGVLDGHVTWWHGSEPLHRCLVVCHDLEGGLNSLWSRISDPSVMNAERFISCRVNFPDGTLLMFTSAQIWKQAALKHIWKNNTLHRARALYPHRNKMHIIHAFHCFYIHIYALQ